VALSVPASAGEAEGMVALVMVLGKRAGGRGTERTLFVTNTVRSEQRSCQVQFAKVMPENIDQPLAGRAARGRSTRDRPAKTPLSLEAVVDAALEILKSDGLAAITMRRVATALDTGPASLYVYVDGREGLLQAMLDRVVSAIELEEPDPSRWRAQLHGLLRRQRQALLSHPGTAALTVADPPTSGSTLMMAENLMGILMAGGLDPQTAAWACDMSYSYRPWPARTRQGARSGSTTAAASKSTLRKSARRSRRCRPTASRCSPPTPRRWSPVRPRSASASRST
jgi:AcrR family transcriptional regulator